MQWLDRSKDLVAMAIATVAVLLSLFTVVIQSGSSNATPSGRSRTC
jgi:hypothetical protein